MILLSERRNIYSELLQRTLFPITVTDPWSLLRCSIHWRQRTLKQKYHQPSRATLLSRNVSPIYIRATTFDYFPVATSISPSMSALMKRRCRLSSSWCDGRGREVGTIVNRYSKTWETLPWNRQQYYYSLNSGATQQKNHLLGLHRFFSNNDNTNTSPHLQLPVASQLRIDIDATLPLHSAEGVIPAPSNETITGSADTTTPRSSTLFDGILSKIGSTTTTTDAGANSSSHTVTASVEIIDWDEDVFRTSASKEDNRAADLTSVVTSGDDDNRKLQEQIMEVNTLRQQDMLKRQSKVLRKYYRKRQKRHSMHSNTDQAIEDAKAYAKETNRSTLEEIQNWTPYTEQDVKRLFVKTYTQQAMFNAKDLNQIIAQFDNVIYSASVLVIPATTSKTVKGKLLPAITSYPKSSLKLFTLLKGMYNRMNTITNPVESSIVKFMVHRTTSSHPENANVGGDRADNTTHATDLDNASESSSYSYESSAAESSFDKSMQQQKDEKIERKDHDDVATTSSLDGAGGTLLNDHGEVKLTDRSYDDRNLTSSVIDPSLMTLSEPHDNFYHQSYAEYVRMMDVLERLRETVHTTLHDQRSKTNIYSKNPEKTKRLASHLACFLPNVLFINLIAILNEIDSSSTTKKKNSRGKSKLLMALRHTKMSSVIDKFYFHFIAAQFSDYFFQLDDESKVTDCTLKDTSTIDSDVYSNYRNEVSKVQLSTEFTSSLDHFLSAQNTFTALLMDVQDILYNGCRVIVLDQEDAMCKKLRKTIMADSSTTNNDENLNDTIESDAIESKLMIPDTAASDEAVVNTENSTRAMYKKMSSKITNQMVESMDESSIRPVGFRKRKVERKIMPVSHLAFEAISLDLKQQPSNNMSIVSIEPNNEALPPLPMKDDTVPQNVNGHSSHFLNGNHAHHNLLSSKSSSPYGRMVFIDNLPIDICPERINEFYSRCGEIESVEIFNQRPELDPGKLAKVEIMKRRAKQTKMSLSARTWSRPKTPVYGLLTFANESGYEKAIDASLRIFGMIIQRHPVRSIPSWCMNTLYIEDIPAGHPCIDLEYQLSYALEPNNIFVCLNPGQNYTSTVGSCEIKFPSFEIAYESFKILQEKLRIFERATNDSTVSTTQALTTDMVSEATLTTSKQCRINWIASQSDAQKWWTRQYGFE